ncbi:MAG TPA: S41 family peptidase [Streptosporangiaceae bacterium]|nr:S41 family peptidase [Streptosporangiaceae bacterium]
MTIFRSAFSRPVAEAVIAVAAVAVLGIPAAAAAGTPVPGAGVTGPGRGTLTGVWRTDGYGMIIVVTGRQGLVYQTTSGSCLYVQQAARIGKPGRGGVQRFGVHGVTTTLAWPVGHGQGWIHPLGSAGNIGMQRIGALPGRCTRPAPRGPVTSFLIFARTFAENYPFFASQHVGWRAVVARYQAQVGPRTSPGELYRVLVDMVRPLHNAHTDVISADHKQAFEGLRRHTRPWSAAFCARAQQVTDQRLGGRLHTWGHGNIAYATLPGHLGYLRLSAFMAYAGEGSSYQADQAVLGRALNTVFTATRVRSLRGLIIDVRCNPGGDDALGLQVASRLTVRPYLAYSKQARDPAGRGGFTALQPIMVRPAHAPLFTGPIAMLTSDLTNSAGETFTQAMIGRTPAPVRIGMATQGVFSDVLNRVLPDGILFGLPNEEFVTPAGTTFDNRGIPPDIELPTFTRYQLTHHLDPVLATARRLLTRHRSPL